MATGWTHVQVIRPGQVHLYNATTGAATALLHDADANITATSPQPQGSVGWTHVVRLRDGELLHYRSSTGEGVLTTFDEAGMAHAPATSVSLPPGLVTLDGAGDGRLIASGAAGVVTLVAFVGATVTSVDDLEVDLAWTRTAPLAEGRVLLYDEVSGRGTILHVDDGALQRGPEISVLPKGSVLIGRGVSATQPTSVPSCSCRSRPTSRSGAQTNAAPWRSSGRA